MAASVLTMDEEQMASIRFEAVQIHPRVPGWLVAGKVPLATRRFGRGSGRTQRGLLRHGDDGSIVFDSRDGAEELSRAWDSQSAEDRAARGSLWSFESGGLHAHEMGGVAWLKLHLGGIDSHVLTVGDPYVGHGTVVHLAAGTRVSLSAWHHARPYGTEHEVRHAINRDATIARTRR